MSPQRQRGRRRRRSVLRDAFGRIADVAQLGLGLVALRPLFRWLRTHRPEVAARARHEPFAARGESFVRSVGPVEKGLFVAKMLGTDGGWSTARPTPPARPRSLRASEEVLIAGDVLVPASDDHGRIDPGLRARIARATAFVVNLEGTLAAERGATQAIAPFLSREGLRQLIAYERMPEGKDWVSRFGGAGFSALVAHGPAVVVSVANNHSLDDGVAGFDVTVDHLRALGARIVGDARRNEGAAVIDVGPHRVGMFALTYGSNRTALRDERLLGFAAVPYRLPHVRVERIVRRLREEQGATHVVALLHWGYEHEHEPGLDQENVVRDLQAAGVDVVIGHHAHVLQRSGAEAGRWVSYSLGDFVGGDRTVWSRFGAMVSLRFDDRGDVHGEVIPIVQSAFWQEQRTSLLEDGPLFERLVFRSFFRAKLPPPHPRARTSAFERSTS